MSTQGIWKPSKFLAVVLGLTLQQFAFLYVNKAKLFWVYLVLGLSLGVASVTMNNDTALKEWVKSGYITLAFALICSIHAFVLAKSYQDEIRKWYAKWWMAVALWLSVLVIIVFVRAFVIEPFAIPSRAMNPTFEPSDHVLVSKTGFGNYRYSGIQLHNSEPIKTPNRGDIIVFQYPQDPNIDYIKRVIGLPGDSIIYRNKTIYLKEKCKPDVADCPDYKAIEKQHVSTSTEDSTSIFIETIGTYSYEITMDDSYPEFSHRYFKQSNTQQDEWIVPETHYFVLGDNRDNSFDSRYWGFVPSEYVVGKVVYRW